MTNKAFIRNIADALREQALRKSKALERNTFVEIRFRSDGSAVAVFQSTAAVKDLVDVDISKLDADG